MYWTQQGDWEGGGNTYTKDDCGGIYGGDTFITRQGIAMGSSILEETRSAKPAHGLHYHIVESEDNINYRHSENQESAYFPNDVAKDILQSIGSSADSNAQDNIKYDSSFSALNDIRTAIPLPLKNVDQDNYPTRTIRSVKTDTSGVIDNYRIFLANQFKDLPKNRGELWKLSTFNNLIYFHMEQSLFKAAGKQTMQMGDGSDAYVGSGDIFKQEPTEIVQTEAGFGGTQSQYAALTTRYGYFFVDRKGKKVFMMKDTLLEISALGMEKWFIDNMNYELIKYGASALDKVDNPIVGLGYHSVWDPYNKRILLTKRDLLPTQAFLDGYYLGSSSSGTTTPGKIKYQTRNNIPAFYIWTCYKNLSNITQCVWVQILWSDETYFDKEGWTISYYPDQAVWCSFHSYVPYIYFNTTETFYSITDIHYKWQGVLDPLYTTNASYMMAFGTNAGNKGIWKHNNGLKGMSYQDNVFNSVASNSLDFMVRNTFELEVIQNSLKGFDTVTASLSYMLDVISPPEGISGGNIRVLEHGFTSFYVYNTFQISGDEVSSPLEYLINTRRVGNNWKVNHFRDLASDAITTTPYYMSTATNIVGGINVGTQTSSNIVSMFTKVGSIETVNALYLDLGKVNLQRRKFIDKWIGIRLIYDNITNNLLNLYSTSVESRKLYR